MITLSFYRKTLGRMSSALAIVVLLYAVHVTPAYGDTLRVQHVVHLIGFDGAKPNSSGDLAIDEQSMQFVAGNVQNTVALKSIRTFSITKDNVALIGGAKGALVGLAPFGVGMASSAVRPSVDTLTLLYVDDHEAIHGAVLLLPQGRGDDISRRLASLGLSPSVYSRDGQLAGTATNIERNASAETSGQPSSVEIRLFQETVEGIPDVFPIVAYEALLADVQKSELFTNVWRQGDKRTPKGSSTLQVTVERLKRGSARSRALVPFTGATTVGVELRLTDSSNQVLLQKKLDAAKRMRGENIEVTKGLSKNICKELASYQGAKKSSGKEMMD